jgi:hypothetical protein
MLKRPEGGRITPVGFSDRQEAFRQRADIVQGRTEEGKDIALAAAQRRADAPGIALRGVLMHQVLLQRELRRNEPY